MQLATGSDALLSNEIVSIAQTGTTRWYSDPTDVLFGMRSFDDGVLYRLTVEPAPTGWDWTVWRTDRPSCVRYGLAGSPAQAMRDAERAVEFLEQQVAAT